MMCLTGQLWIAGKGSTAVAWKLNLWNDLNEALCCICHNFPDLQKATAFGAITIFS